MRVELDESLITDQTTLAELEGFILMALRRITSYNVCYTKLLRTIRDADMTSEMAQFTKYQIMMQAGTAMLAQANQIPNNILQLLR